MKPYVHATIASFFAWAGNIYDLLIITYVYEYLEKYLGLNTLDGTLLFALGLIFRVIGGYVFGKIADIKGRKIILILGTAGYALFQGVIAFSPDIVILLLARSLQGLFMGAEWTAGTVIAYENAPINLRGLINGVVQAGYGMGYALTGMAFILFSPYMEGIGWRIFLLTGALPLALLPYIQLKVQNVSIKLSKIKVDIKEYYSVLIRSSVIISGMFFSYYSIFAVYPEFSESIGLSKNFVGSIMLVSNIALGISFIIFGRLADRISKRKLIIGGVIGEMIGLPFMLPILVSLRSPPTILSGLMLYSVSTGFWPLAPLLIVESVPPTVRSALTGLSYNLGSVIGGIGSIIMGSLVQVYGLSSASLWGNIMGYASLTVVMATLLIWPRGSISQRS